MNVSDYISMVAVAIAGLAWWETRKANNAHSHLSAREIELVRIQISKENNEAERNRTAHVSARLMKIDSRTWRLRVFNKGPSEALNVRLVLDDQNEIVTSGWTEQKFPMKKLEVGQNVDLPARVHMQVKPKETVTIKWDDFTGTDKENTVEITI